MTDRIDTAARRMIRAAKALHDAFGGDTPQWISGEVERMYAAIDELEAAVALQPSDPVDCPVNDPSCEGGNGDCHDACEHPVPLCQHCGDDLTSNPCGNCNGFNEVQA